MSHARCPLVLTLALLLPSTPAWAQTIPGIALDRFDPSERGSDWFANESLDLRGHLRPAAGLVIDYASAPLVAYDQNGDKAAEVVSDTLVIHPGAALVLFDRLRLGVSIPVQVASQGDPVLTPEGDFAAGDGPALGDARVGADVRLVGVYGGPFSLAAGVRFYAPTGSRTHYTSDGTVRLLPRAMAAGDVGPFTWATQVGFHVRPEAAEFAGAELGHELTYAAAAGVRLLDRKLLIGPEVFGSTTVADAFGAQTTPVELVGAAAYTLARNLRVGLGAGPGLTQGLGTPELRVLAKVEYFPAMAENYDRDGDGVSDVDDRCPGRPAGPKPDPARRGCPAADRDRDGVVDFEDACPLEPGADGGDPMRRGCPAAPTPPPAPVLTDADGDGVIDGEDACPKEKGVPSRDPKVSGCPAARLEKEIQQIRILHRIEFDYDAASIRPESTPTLEAVRQILAEHPEVELVEIQGHTDDAGPDGYNKKLSDRRARAVLDWLVEHGIAAERMQSQGLGEERPIAANDTDEGRQANRRVEFHILRDGGAPQNESAPAGSVPAQPAAPQGAPAPGAAPPAGTRAVP